MVRLAKNVFLLLIILKYNWLFWHIDWQIYHNKNRAIPLHTNRRSNNFRKITQSRNCLPFVSIWVHLWPFGGVHVAHIFSCYASLRPWIPCYDVRYDFRMNTMFGSCLPPVIVRGLVSYFRYLCLFTHSGVQHILCCLLLCFSSSFVPDSLDCAFLIAPSVFSNVYLRNNCLFLIFCLLWMTWVMCWHFLC